MKITLTKVKEAGGDETPRFKATLCVDGKAVAVVSNGGTGGCCHYDWLPAPGMSVLGVKDGVWREAERLCGDRFEPLDALVYRLLDLHATKTRIDRACKKSTLVRHHGDERGVWRSINRPFGPEIAARLAADPKVAVVLNALSSEERAERVVQTTEA